MTRGSALAQACSSPSIRSISGARPSMTARQSVTISRKLLTRAYHLLADMQATSTNEPPQRP